MDIKENEENDDQEYMEYLEYLKNKQNKIKNIPEPEPEPIKSESEEIEEIKPKKRMTRKGVEDKRSSTSKNNVSKARNKVKAYLTTAKKLLNEPVSSDTDGDEYIDVILKSKKQDELDKIKPEPKIIKRQPLKKLLKEKKQEEEEPKQEKINKPEINEIEEEKKRHKAELEQLKKEIEEEKNKKKQMKENHIEALRNNFILKF